MIKRWQPWLAGVLLAGLLAVIAAHAYIGSFSRIMADTYCYAANDITYGLLGAQRIWYTGWTGRYSFNLAESLTGLGGPRLVPLLPAAVLLAWLAAVGGAVWLFDLSSSTRKSACLAALLSALIVGLTLRTAPFVAQSLYWSSGMNNYVPPLVLSPLVAGVLAYSGRHSDLSGPARWAWAAVAGLLVFVASGFSEMFGALQMAALVILAMAAIVFGSSPTRRRLLPAVAACLLGSALGLAIVVAAPGNRVRAASFPPPVQILALLGLALQFTVDFLRTALQRNALTLLAALAIPAALGLGWLWPVADAARLPVRRLVPILFWTPVITLALFVAAFAAPAFGLSAPPPARALIVPTCLLIIALAVWGFALGGLLRRADPSRVPAPVAILGQVALAAALLIFAASLFRAAQQNLARKPTFEAYALAWDTSERLILAARAEEAPSVTVPPRTNPYGLEEPGADQKYWLNECVSLYYGLQVSASPP